MIGTPSTQLESTMTAAIYQLHPQAHQPTPENFGNYLRRLAAQYETEQVGGISVVVTNHDGAVEMHHSDEQSNIISR